MPIIFFPAARLFRGACSGQRWPSVLALSIAALAIAGCSEKAPTKDQILSRANEAFAAQRYVQAEKDYREVLRLAPDDPVAMRRLGILYFDQGQIIQAYPLLKKYSGLQPDDAEMQVKFGLALLATGDYPQAREAALLALSKRPGDEQALSLLADTTRSPEEIEDVRKSIEDLRKKDQDRPSYHLALGSLDLRKGEKARAEKQFKTALEKVRKHIRRSKARYVVVGAANDPSALGATRAFQEAGQAGTCAVVGHNAEPDARAELREPRTPFVASVAFFPERYGDGLIKLAFDILAHRPVPPALFTHHQLVTTANVDHLYPNDALLGGTARAAG